MKFEWDKNKESINIDKHGLDFKLSSHLFKSKMVFYEDQRKSYNEKRYIGYGVVSERCINIVFTVRKRTIRVISLRRANKSEIRKYNKAIKSY